LLAIRAAMADIGMKCSDLDGRTVLNARQGISILFVVACVAASGARAQEPDAARRAYLDAVATYFRLPPGEVAILADWAIAPDEVPAVLFVAGHAGVSPEAIVALRRSGLGWSRLVERYQIGPSALHVPVRDEAPTGALSAAYQSYRETPVGEWSTIRLTDEDVVGLVNVRMIAQTLRLSVEDVIRHAGSARSYVELFAQLSR
jgi:hypothetical protein